MTRSIELDEELLERLEQHTDEGQSVEELIQELLSIYEHEGRFTAEGP